MVSKKSRVFILLFNNVYLYSTLRYICFQQLKFIFNIHLQLTFKPVYFHWSTTLFCKIAESWMQQSLSGKSPKILARVCFNPANDWGLYLSWLPISVSIYYPQKCSGLFWLPNQTSAAHSPPTVVTLSATSCSSQEFEFCFLWMASSLYNWRAPAGSYESCIRQTKF